MEMVCEYNKQMGAVDEADTIKSFTESTRKTIRCTESCFFHLMNVMYKNLRVFSA